MNRLVIYFNTTVLYFNRTAPTLRKTVNQESVFLKWGSRLYIFVYIYVCVCKIYEHNLEINRSCEHNFGNTWQEKKSRNNKRKPLEHYKLKPSQVLLISCM